MPRALVTGGTGFLGSHLVAELRREGWEVVCLVRRPVISGDAGVSCVTADLGQPAALGAMLHGIGRIDCVFHFGAVLPAQQPAPTVPQYWTVNALATVALLEWAGHSRVASFVYASGVAVVGAPEQLPVTETHPLAPTHPYLISKLAGELACETARRIGRCSITSLRITSPYGPGMPPTTVLPRFLRQAQDSEPLRWFGSGKRSQNFVHITDVIRAGLLAAQTARPGVYNIGGPSAINMRNLAETIIRLTPGSRSRAEAAGQPDPQDGWRWEVDLSRAATELGYRPSVTIEAGLADYIRRGTVMGTPWQWWSPPS